MNQGLSKSFLVKHLEYLKELGYSSVMSFHKPSHRIMFVTKARIGFEFAGTRIHPDLGLLMVLALDLNKEKFWVGKPPAGKALAEG